MDDEKLLHPRCVCCLGKDQNPTRSLYRIHKGKKYPIIWSKSLGMIKKPYPEWGIATSNYKIYQSKSIKNFFEENIELFI